MELPAIEIITIVLSLVALFITIIGFFASLKFYRDGNELQKKANDAMVRIEEKSLNIEKHVEGQFNKMIDYIFNRDNSLNYNTEEINKQLEKFATDIINFAQTRIANFENSEKQEIKNLLSEIIDTRLNTISKVVDKTKEDAKIAEYVTRKDAANLIQESILEVINNSKKPLSADDISKKVGVEKTDENFRVAISNLVSHGYVSYVYLEGRRVYSPKF